MRRRAIQHRTLSKIQAHLLPRLHRLSLTAVNRGTSLPCSRRVRRRGVRHLTSRLARSRRRAVGLAGRPLQGGAYLLLSFLLASRAAGWDPAPRIFKVPQAHHPCRQDGNV